MAKKGVVQDKRITVFVPEGYAVTFKQIPAEEYFAKKGVQEPDIEEQDKMLAVELKVSEKLADIVNAAIMTLPDEFLVDIGKKYAEAHGIKVHRVDVVDGAIILFDKKGRRMNMRPLDMVLLLNANTRTPPAGGRVVKKLEPVGDSRWFRVDRVKPGKGK